jgi:hypothetical protein
MSTTLDLEATEWDDETADVWVRELLGDVRLCSSAFGSELFEGKVSSDVLKRRSKPEFGVVDRCFSSTRSSVLFIAWMRSRIDRVAHDDAPFTSEHESAGLGAIISCLVFNYCRSLPPLQGNGFFGLSYFDSGVVFEAGTSDKHSVVPGLPCSTNYVMERNEN